jgi:peptidoglycan/LPS O-acetylase OafA/YrhL
MLFLDRIRRVTRDGRWIPEIDGLRFVAIMSVLLFHMLLEVHEHAGRIISIEPRYSGFFRFIGNGDYGVELFFIISGFVLALPFARHLLKGADSVSLRKYFLRRVTRLEPPYILSIILFVGMLFAYTHHLTADDLKHALATAFYQHGLVYGTKTLISAVSWSLEIEIQFYIVAPLIMQLYRVRPPSVRRALISVIIIGISVAQYAIVDSPRATLSILFYAQFFVMGILLADFYIVDGDRIRPSLWWDAAGIAGLVLSFGMTRGFAAVHVILPWTLVLVFAGALRSVFLRSFFANPWIATIGGMCYSIYLIHLQMIAVFFKFTRHCIVSHFDFLANFAIQMLVTAVPVLLICVGYYLLIERPGMDPNWPSKLWHWMTGHSRSEAVGLDTGGISESDARGSSEPAGVSEVENSELPEVGSRRVSEYKRRLQDPA